MSESNETAPASPAALNAPLTEITLVTERLLRWPDRFERPYEKFLEALDGPYHLQLMLEISNLTQERGEVAAFSSSMLRRIMENWKAEDYEEMGVDKAKVEEKWGLNCLIPLSDLDTSMDPSRRGRCSKERPENTWGEDLRVNLEALCYDPSPASAWTLNATTHSILSLVPRTGLDCLTASKPSYSRIRNWTPVLCSPLRNKLTVDFKSFCLFLLVSMTDSYSKKESGYESSLHCCVTMILVYKPVFSPF